MHIESVDIQTQMYSTAIPWAFTHLSLAYYKKACVSPAFVLTGLCLGSESFGRTGWGRGPGLTLWPHPLDFPHQPLDICQYDKNGIAYTCAHICLYILEFLFTFCITSCYIWHSSETVCVCVVYCRRNHICFLQYLCLSLCCIVEMRCQSVQIQSCHFTPGILVTFCTGLLYGPVNYQSTPGCMFFLSLFFFIFYFEGIRFTEVHATPRVHIKNKTLPT